LLNENGNSLNELNISPSVASIVLMASLFIDLQFAAQILSQALTLLFLSEGKTTEPVIKSISKNNLFFILLFLNYLSCYSFWDSGSI
jgi:hypothetical protein